MSTLADETVLSAAPDCVVRELADGGYLFYSPATDELHLVPRTGFYVFQLCNGVRSVQEIQQRFEDALDEGGDHVRMAVTTFLARLIERRLLVLP